MISTSGPHRRFARAGRILRSWSNHAECQVAADQAMADKALAVAEGAQQVLSTLERLECSKEAILRT